MAGPDLACRCGCREPRGTALHRVAHALAGGDLDGAIEAGLLALPPCPGCSTACSGQLADARQAREMALAARDRFRARTARLERRASARTERRAPPARPGSVETAPALPPAAAAALARARAKAATGR